MPKESLMIVELIYSLKYQKMRKKIFTAAIMALALTMLACGKKEKTSKEDNAYPSEEMADAESVISSIREVWKTKTIDVGDNEGTPDIGQFAFAFCEEYPDYEPNAALQEYLAQPKDYNEENTDFHINDDTSNGYLSSTLMTEYDFRTDCCYWKRKNGHQLVAFWLCEQHEGMDVPENLVLFYDYDPKTFKMTPEPQLTELVEKNTASFPTYEVRLPDEGKDIEIMTYTDADEESYDVSSFKMIWNGQNFIVKK